MTSQVEKQGLIAEIDELSRMVFLTETNQGTYGPHEAAEKCGTSDPAYSDRSIFETVAGTRWAVGAEAEKAPGYMRKIAPRELTEARLRTADLRAQLRSI